MHTFDLFRSPARLASASLNAAGSAGGSALGAVVHVLAAARHAPKPLHPRGRTTHATVTRFGSPELSGVPWIDEKGTGPAVVRHSGAVGFPLGSPDIRGLAVRVHDGDIQGDLLFATTGLGRLNRFILTGSTRIDGRPYTTLLPYRGPSGPVLLGLEPKSPISMDLLWAHGSGKWHVFGSLQLTDPYDGPAISFDPMLKTLPGLIPYPWVRALRAPAYRVARRHRGEPSLPPNDQDDLLLGRAPAHPRPSKV